MHTHKDFLPSHIQSVVKPDNWNSFLNLVFSQGSEQEVKYFFETLSELQKDNFNTSDKTKIFFEGIYEMLLHVRKVETFYFDFEGFVAHLNFDVIVKIHKARRDLPVQIRKKMYAILNSIEGYEDASPKQSKAYLAGFNIVTQQIKNIFLSTSNLFIDKDFLFFCERFADKYQSKTQDTRVNILSNIIYQSRVTPESRDKILSDLDSYKKPSFESVVDFVFSDLVKSLASKKEEKFFEFLAVFVQNYKKENSVDELSREDKVKIFFSPYLKKFTETYENVIEMLLANYQEKVFNKVFDIYQLPINCPIRFEKDEMRTEERDDKIIKKLVKKINYYNITEYCLENGLEHIAVKIFKKYKDACFANFETKTIENDNIYHYQYQFLKSYVAKKEEHILFLIKNGCINYNTKMFYKNEDGAIVYDSIFFYLVFHQYYKSFIELYYIAIRDEFAFATLRNKDGEGLFLFFIKNIFDKMEKKKTLKDFEIFCSHINESGVDLFHQDSQTETVREHLAEIGKMDISQLIYLIEKFSKIFPLEWFSSRQEVYFSTEENSTSEPTEKKINWFNRSKLESHLEKLSQQKDSSNIYVINQMLQDDNHLKRNLFIEDEGIFSSLEEEFPNFSKVINFYKGQFRMKELSNKINVQPVLLLGPPGIGKTYFAKKLAEYLKTGYTFLDLGTMSAKWILSGANGTWKDAKQGKVLDSIIHSPTINPVIVMDEIDKARGGDYDPTVVLYQLLEEINSKDFTDEFIDFSFNASGVIYIACANDAYKLSEPLLSRFKIFDIDLPNDEQFEKIIQNIYREATQQSQFFTSQLSFDVVELLKGKSMRNIKSIIQDATNKAIVDMDSKEISQRKISKELLELTSEHFGKLYEKREIGF